jgi:hypothetical protein
MNRLSRATALKVAAVISFVMGIYSIFSSIPFLARGYVEPEPGVAQIPYFVIIAAFALAIMSILGAFSTWKQQRWGIVLLLIVSAADLVLALPGLVFAPSTDILFSAIVGVLNDVAVIILCLWRDRRPVTL